MLALRNLHIKTDKLLIRPTSTIDSFSTIATILYDAEPEVFSAWFGDDRERGISVLTHLCSEPRSFFSFDHCVVAEDTSTHQITGIANIVDSRTRLDYDYTFLEQHDPRAAQVIDFYIYNWIDQVRSHDNTVLFILNLCGTDGNRLNRISANELMSILIPWSRAKGYNKIITQCPREDKSSRNFYKSHGFIGTATETYRYIDSADPVLVTTFTYRHT